MCFANYVRYNVTRNRKEVVLAVIIFLVDLLSVLLFRIAEMTDRASFPIPAAVDFPLITFSRVKSETSTLVFPA